MSYIIQTNDLTKAFNGTEVVSRVNMHIKKGEIYGFLGPNGAGKTTILKLIMNLLKPTMGEIEIFNESLHDKSTEYLKRVGSLIEYPVFYEELTAKENLEIHCEYMGYYKKGVVDEALGLVNLKDTHNKKVKEFSLGMKQRLGIARTIVTKPEILILDEPINGLDPLGIKEMRHLFKMLSRDYGMTILISSHIISEIDQIADTIGVINKGVLIEEVSIEQIRAEQPKYIEIQVNDAPKASYILDSEFNLRNFKVISEDMIRIYDSVISSNHISKKFIENDIEVSSIQNKNASLEEYFINLIDGGDIHA